MAENDLEIALLGWGSLVWKPGLMKIIERWHFDGPMLPIEFARISRNPNTNIEQLTLVPYDGAKDVPSLWTRIIHKDIVNAICNLAEREDCSVDSIGYINLKKNEYNCKVVPKMSNMIAAWAISKDFEAVVWTDLPSNFFEETGGMLTEYNVLEYLKKQSKDGNSDAREYFERAPQQIKTHIRDVVEKELGWSKQSVN